MATRRQISTRLLRPQTKAGLVAGVVAVALLLLVVGSATAITIFHNHHSQTPTATLVTINGKGASSDIQTPSARSIYSSKTGSDETTTKAETEGRSIVQSAIPAVEAYYQDHMAYEGMTVAALRSDYDATISGITVIYAHADKYCIASTGKPTYYVAGPNGTISETPCSKDDSPTSETSARRVKAAAHAASIVQNAIPAIEAYYQDYGDSYPGLTVAILHDDYDATIAGITVIYAHADTYCIASTGKPTYYVFGPDGKPTPTPCSEIGVTSTLPEGGQ